MNDIRPPQKPAPAPGKKAAWVLAIAMHLLLAAFLIYGVHWQTKSTEAVEVELVRALPAAVPPTPTFVPKPPAPKPEPKPEPKPLPLAPKPDIAIKEPKKKPPKTPEKVVPPKPVPPKEIPRPDPFKEQLQRESEQLEKQKRDAALAAALDKELDGAKAAQAASARSKAADSWKARIQGKIRGNIVLPPEVKGNPEAIFNVTQIPASGEILTVHLQKSSGNAALDRAIERAILKSSPLPKPEQSGLSQRDLKLTFRPMED